MRYPQGILVSCEIPWDENERFMADIFREEVRAMIAKGYRQMYIFGTCGEGYAVDTTMFRDIVTVFREETSGEDVLAQVGVITLSTANAVERIGSAHGLGFRVFQIALPSWGVVDDDEMMAFFKDVCGTFPDSKFLHYNLPRAKRILNGHDYRRVADAVPNLVGTKNTTVSLRNIGDLMRHAPDLQHFLSEGGFPYGCLYGECSILGSFAGVSPTKMWQLFDTGKSGKIEESFRIARAFDDVWSDVFLPTDYRQESIDGAYDKMLVKFSGVDMPLRLLSPYKCFPDEVYEQCRKILVEKYPEWLT